MRYKLVMRSCEQPVVMQIINVKLISLIKRIQTADDYGCVGVCATGGTIATEAVLVSLQNSLIILPTYSSLRADVSYFL